MKNFKRIVGLLLCLAMMLSFVPASVVSAAESTGTDTTTQNLVKSDILEKINLSGTVVGACSQNNAADIEDLIWYNKTEDGKSWNKHLSVVDGSASSVSSFNCGSPERADWYLDLSGNDDGYTAVDKFVLYAGGTTAVSDTKVVFILNNGQKWEETFETNWNSADDTLTYTFDETINATGMYVWQTDNTVSCLGEIELYQYAYVNNLTTAKLNGVDLSQYKIVYSASDLDYAKTAAEYLHKQILLKTGRNVEVVTDATDETTYEIQVGNVNRTYAKSISAPSETAMKFTFASDGTKIAMKADYFIIAGAAYYFVETYIDTNDFEVTANTGVTTQNTITKKAKNYIFMIGDGMGEMHTKLFQKYGAAPTTGTYGYSDGENIFYGYYLPYLGWQKTANYIGEITDSAAAGTALATGYKTTNGFVGKDRFLNDVKNMSELAMEYNKSVAVMSTEGVDGATPSAYSAHADGRYNENEIISDQASFGGLLIDGYNNYNTYTKDEWEDWEPLVKAGLNSVASDPDGFFIMYEEAHIDKVSHRLDSTSPEGYTGDTSMETLFRTVYRFNQAIGIFMEYALYNPDTMLLITADHETAGLDSNFKPTESNPVDEQKGGSVWNHSLKDVPVFSYGEGAEIFHGATAENASYARTWAHLMTDGEATDFGSTAYPIIGSGESGEEEEDLNFYTDLPTDATKLDVTTAPTVGYYSDNNTAGAITEYVDATDGPGKLIDGTYDQKENRTISGYYTYEELADGTKIPVILFEFDEEVNVAGIKLTGYEFGRYNIEDFDIEVYAHDGASTSWYTAAMVRDAFTTGTHGEQITTPMEIGFNQIRTATKMRIVVKDITNMSAEAKDDADSAELATGSYFRIKEIEVYETDYVTVEPKPTDPTEPTEPVATEPVATEPEATSPVGPAQITVQSAIAGVYNDGKTHANLTAQQDATKLIDGDESSSITVGASNDDWIYNVSGFAGNGGDYTPAAILTLEAASTIDKVVLYPNHSSGKYSATDVTIEYFDGTKWVTINSFEIKDFSAPAEMTFAAVTTTKIRVLVDNIDRISGATAQWLPKEIKVYGAQAGGETPEPTDPTDPTNPTEPTEPDVLPDITLEPITNAPTPIVGYYTDNNTDGEVAEDNYWIQEGDKGKDPSVLVDGEKGEETGKNYNWTGYYRYDDVASGAKIPVYLFEFDEPVAFTGVEIDTYKAMYYAMEDFTVQVYIDGKGWVTATTVADSFGAQTQEEYADPITYPFAEPLYGTKIRILVDKLWNMYDWRYDDEHSFNLEYEASIRLREITLMEDPDYVPPEDAANTLMPPSSLDTEFTDTTITAVAPPSTEYPEAEIRYAVYLNGALVEANSTGIFTGLQPNTRYTIYAKYIGDGEEWLDSHPISNTTATDKLKLPTPNVEVDLTSTSITATADEVEGGELQFRLLDANHVAIGEWQSSGNFTGLTPSTTYYIQARYNGDTNHYDSEVRTLEVETGKILLNKPTLTVSGTTHNTITLNALPTVTGGTAEYSYRVEGGEWIVASGNVITGLNPDTTYELRAHYVATDDSYNTSLYSEVVTATTKMAPLPAPNVSVGNITDAGFTVSADTNENGTLMFSIDGIKWFEADANGSYPFTGLNRNTKYTVQAKYVGKNGYSDSEVATTEATTEKTQLTNPTGFIVVATTENSITVKADTVTGGTLKFSIDSGEHWQTENVFTNLNPGTEYTIWAKYFADEDYIESGVTTNTAKTWTILDAPDLSATSTDVTITATAPAVEGGTLKFRINGRDWQYNGNFTGLKSNTEYTIEAMYEAEAGYVSSTITKITVTTQKGIPGTNGDYVYLEAIRESDVTAHVGYNRYSNHEMLSENLEQSALINDAMYGTISKIMGAEAVPADKLADGYRLLSIVYDLNNGTTKLGAIEITGGDYNLTKFTIQVRNTKGVWQTVKFVTNDLFDISEALRNKTVLIPFTPVEGTQVRLMINGYEANENNAPEIRELVIYEVKEDALQEKKAVTSADAPAVIDGNKATVYTGNAVTLSFNQATSVKRLKLFGNTESDSINGYTIKVQTAKGGEWTEVASGNAYSRAFNTSIVNLDKEYMAYGVQVIANGTVAIPEIEVYGYKDAPEDVDPTPETTPGATAPTEAIRPPVVSPEATQAPTLAPTIPNGDVGMVDPTVAVPNVGDESGDPVIPGLDIENEKAEDPTVAPPVVGDESAADPEAPTAPVVTQKPTEAPVIGKLDLSESDVYTLSTDFNPNLDYADQNWAHTDFTEYVDGDTETWDYWTVWGERADCYVDIGATVSATQLNLYYIGYLSSSDPNNKYSYMPTVTITLVLTNGTVTETFDTGWKKATADSLTWTFGQTYEIKGIYIWSEETPIYQNKSFSLAEIELYGYVGGGSGSDTYTPGTAGMTQLDLTGRVTGACSEENPSTTTTNLSNMIWYSTQKPSWDKPWKTATVDNNSSTELHFGAGGTGERADYYLDLTNGAGGYTAVDQIKMYHSGYAAVTAVTFILVLEDGSEVKKEFTGLNWKTSKDVDPIVWDFGQTYKVEGVYVWEPNNTTAAFGEIELYQKQTVTLDAPTVDWTSKNDTSITVKAAKIDASIGKLQFSIDGGSSWKDAVDGSYTFENLTGNTAYTIQAKYVATASGYISSAVGSATVTTEATPVTSFVVSGTTTAGAKVQLYKDTAVVATVTANDGSFGFTNVSIGTYTLVATKDGYNYKILEIVVNANKTGLNMTLSQAAYTVSGTTTAGATVKLYKDGKLVAGKEVVANGGSYTFDDVPVGAYTLVATLDGYHARTEVIIVGAAVSQDMTLTKATYTVSGTVTGDTADAVTVTLYKNGEAVKSVTTADGKYTFTDVVIGNYSLMVTKANHVAQGATITVNNTDVTKDFALEYVKPYVSNVVVDAVYSHTYNVRLYEPWALRVKVSFYTEKNGTALNLNDSNVVKSYGAYAVIAHKLGKDVAAPTSWEDIVNNPNAVQFRQAAGEGDCNMFVDGDTTAVFDYYDGLYTYRLAENVYWVAYYEDAEGTIHFTDVESPKLMDKVENIIGKIAGDEDQDTQRIVLEHMQELHYALKDFRGEDAEFGKEYTNDVGVLNYGQNLSTTNASGYQFGKTHKIRLIEPWGLKVTYQVKPRKGAVYTDADFENLQDYGMIFYHDKTCAYNGDMTSAQVLAMNDVYIYSNRRGNVVLEDGKMTAIYTKELYTYILDSDVFCVPFVVDADGNYHYSPNANRMNLIDQMYAYFNNTTLSNKERSTFAAMIKLHESTMVHRKKYGK